MTKQRNYIKEIQNIVHNYQSGVDEHLAELLFQLCKEQKKICAESADSFVYSDITGHTFSRINKESILNCETVKFE